MTTAVIVIEVILGVILLISLIRGVIDGFIKGLIGLVTLVLSMVAGLLCGKLAGSWLFTAVIREPLINNLSAQIYEKAQGGSPISLFLGLQNFISVDSSTVSTEEQALTLSTKLVDASLKPIIVGFITVVVFLIIFFICMAIFKRLARASKKINDVQVLGPINRILGGVLGLALGAVACFILVTVFDYLVNNLGNVFSFVTPEQLGEGKIYSLFSGFSLSDINWNIT